MIDLATMDNQHLINNAYIDIGYDDSVVAFEQQAEVDVFAKSNLMHVVDTVLNEHSDPDTYLRIESVEIELGSIPFKDYRQQMPQRLREQLTSILQEKLYLAEKAKSQNGANLDKDSRVDDQLFYFLKHGYLPWYSRELSFDTIEQSLVEMIKLQPEKFIDLIRPEPASSRFVERILKQFSENTITLISQLLTSSLFDLSKDQQQKFEEWRKQLAIHPDLDALFSQLVLALTSGEDLNLESIWAALFEDRQTLLRNTLLFYGQKSNVRRFIASQFSPAMIDDVIRLLEPSGYHFIRNAMSYCELFLSTSDNSLLDSSAGTVKFLELNLSVVMVQRSGVFSKKTYLETLVTHCSAINQASLFSYLTQLRKKFVRAARNDAFAAEMVSLLSELVPTSEQGRDSSNRKHFSLARPYAEYERVKAATTRSGAPSSSEETGLLNDLHSLIEESPWLFMRLFRELQMNESSRIVLFKYFSLALLRKFIDCVLIVSAQKHGDFISAMNANAAQSTDQEKFYRNVLNSLVKGKLLNLDSLSHGANLANYYIDQIDLTSDVKEQAAKLISAGVGGRNNRSSDDLKKIVVAFELLLSSQPEELRKILESNINNESFFTDLAEVLPQDFQHELWSIVESIEPGYRIEYEKRKDVSPAAVEEVVNTVAVAKEIVFQYLSGPQSLSENAIDRLIQAIELLILDQPDGLRQLLLPNIENDDFRIKMVRYLPEKILVKFLGIMGVKEAEKMLQSAELLNVAASDFRANLSTKQLLVKKWHFLYQYIVDSGFRFNRSVFVRQYLESFEKEISLHDSQRLLSTIRSQLEKNTLPATHEITMGLLKTLEHPTGEIDRAPGFSTSEKIKHDQRVEDEPTAGEDIYIANAGIVLTTPYLPRLFDVMGLTEKSQFKSQSAAERAVHILQYLVNQSISSPEYQLVLNKLLCGVKPGFPIQRSILLSSEEREQLDSLLVALITHWKSLGNTSIAGLRESFLQRHGRLQLNKDAWHLSVESKAFDLLLDQIPWSYSTIKFPWMERVIYVEWR